jgi:hypothetical protein
MLVRAFLSAFALSLPSTQAVLDRHGQALGTTVRSTLSYALRRASSLALVRRMWEALDELFRPGEEALVALDSMPLTLPSTRRHGCRPINSSAVGGGVLWAFLVNAAGGSCPVRILSTITGPWHDTKVVAQVRLTARGPVYLMDRGFWALHLVVAWLSQEVRFVLRVTRQSLVYRPVRSCGRPRTLPRGIRVEFDGVATLGGKTCKRRPTVRLVVAYLANGEDLILASDRMDWSAERLVDAYRERWQIERYHRVLKECVGLAHLYSFQENGLLFLLYTATLFAALLVLNEAAPRSLTVDVLLEALTALRSALGIPATAWRPNTAKPMKRSGGGKKRRPTQNH